ncbi:amino acid adenylation domain-containing protein [Paenibacillus sp. J5C_2022]|nr:amino acid adenylation domain-containing protein [Paenibacillus sp. J5C2022]
MTEWKTYMSQMEERTMLRVPSTNPSSRLEKYSYSWPEMSGRDIQLACSLAQIAPQSLIAAAWGMLLMKYLRTEEAAFVVVHSAEHTYPLKLSADGATALETVVQQADAVMADNRRRAISMQDVSDLCGLGGEMPLCNTAVVTGGIEVADQLQGRFDYVLSYSEEDGGSLTVMWDGSKSGIFARRMVHHMRRFVEGWLQKPKHSFGHIQLLTDEEERLLAEWNDSPQLSMTDDTVHGLIERQANKTPQHPAIIHNDQSITYEQLNARANALAGTLAARGARRGEVVGIVATPSLEMAIGVLAILKTGAAYMPIDPAYPADRIQYMLEDSGAGLLVTEPNVKLDEGIAFSGEILCAAEASREEWHIADWRQDDDFSARAEDLAYMIYTSGSTGRPKGVMIEHRSLINLCNWHVAAFGVTERDRATKYAGFGFDASVWEVFPYLLSGASLYMIPDDIRLDASKLHAFFVEHEISISFLPTQFCEQFMTREMPSLRILLTGGDKLKSFHKQGYKLYNCYGPTENTVVTTAHEVTELNENIPIGKPITGSQVHILDRYGYSQPIGIPGELCVTGCGLARGYRNQPELTAEKFVDRSVDGLGLLYRTGDLARWTEAGEIEFLGRIDYQVKIRGFRIEIGEIEHTLLQHPVIEETIVVDLEDASGSKYLCAYIVGKQDVDYRDMARHLGASLPGYMIPAQLVQLPELPLTANGKVDRRALPAPEATQAASIVPPEGKWEIAIAELWHEVLQLSPIGACDSFFLSGGDSLKLVALQTRLERRFEVSVPIAELFQQDTVRGQAEWLKEAAGERSFGEAGGIGERKAEIVIAQAAERSAYPLSSAQKRLYFIEQMEGVGTAYNAPFVFRIDGKMDVHRLEGALRSMLDRHASLRTTYHVDGDTIVQRVQSHAPFRLSEVETAPGRLNEAIRAFVQPFDLSRAPLMRAALVSGDGLPALVVDFHHIAVDGVSANVWFRELSQAYRGEELPELAVSFTDFAVWESERSLPEEGAAYWQRSLAGELPILQLQTDKARPDKLTYIGETLSWRLDERRTGALKSFAAKTGTTPFMVLFAGYKALLARYSNQEDIVTGVPVAGRLLEELQGVVGMFVNTLPVRVFPEKGKTFSQLLQEVKAILLGAFQHQDCELEELVRSLNIPRDTSRNLLFDTLFVMQNTGKLELRLDGAKVDQQPYFHPVAKYDLMVDITEERTELRIDVQYNTALFEQEAMSRFGERYIRLLVDAIGHPDRKLGELRMLSEEETDQVVRGLNDTVSAYAGGMTIHGLFEEQALRTPDKQALVFGEQSMTYRELNERANALAHTLRRKGVRRDEVVGLMAERSFEMIIGLVAILKAGGAYVPIDPEYPQDRVQYMLANSNTRLLLTQRKMMDGIAFEGEVLCLDDEGVYNADISNPPHVNEPQDLLYVIYTSGTTGKPKGVMIEHRNIVNLLHDQYTASNVDYSANVLQFTTISFDVCSQEIWSTLAAGGTLHLITSELRMNVGELLATIGRDHIETLFMPVSFLKFILNEKEYAESFPSTVKHIITAGEQLIVPEKFRSYLTRHGVHLHNHYGPSETHVVTTYTIDPHGHIPELPPIGKPIANTQIYIVNEAMQPQPIGVAGELYISGYNVGRGYYNNEDMTRERYVANPFRPGERMYKTGDLARWTKAGTIEFLGRLDHQVKIRGFRIELGEVENILLNHSAVAEAIVVAREDGKGGLYLCAYFTASRDMTVSELREHLGRTLPDYMIPSYFMQLMAMPLTPNGKIDRKALPQPEAGHARSRELVAPRTETEQAVLEVWREVLQTDAIGVHDNFFELGGHSLKATVVVARLQKKYELGMNDIFEHQSIAKLAAKLKPKQHHLRERLNEIKSANLELDQVDTTEQRASYMARFSEYKDLDIAVTNSYEAVLLTGATGYLGAHMLYEMIMGKAWHVYAVVRGANDEEARKRLIGKCTYYFGPDWYPKHEGRIHVYAGDISKKGFGLSGDVYRQLADKIDAIFHAAANVKHYGAYAEFYEQNVKATELLLSFAEAGKRKHMHHMSTLGVATGSVSDMRHVCFSEYELDIGQQFENYYAKTKFEAECLVAEARRRGIQTCIYRLGNIVFHSVTGRFQENIADNAFYTTMKSMLALGVAPGTHTDVDFSYVDEMSRAIVTLADCGSLRNEIYHLANPHEVNIGHVVKSGELSVNVEIIPFSSFADYLFEHYEDEQLGESVENIMLHYGWMDETILQTFFHIFSDKTLYVLEKLGFRWSPLTQGMITSMFHHSKEKGYI